MTRAVRRTARIGGALVAILAFVLATAAPAAAQERRPRDPSQTAARTQSQAPAAAPAALASPQHSRQDFHRPDDLQAVKTSHTITVGGRPLAYTAVAGTLLLRADDGRARAYVYFTAYFKDGVADVSSRPLAFVYNGGPGSSSVWLHMGAFGPRKVRLAEDGNALSGPVQVVDNEYTLLDSTDLCFLDPVSTGYSRPYPGENPAQFYGYVEDIQACGDFIRDFVGRFERWASPKLLIGESYGTTRSAGLSGYLQNGANGMYLDGIVLVSAVLNFGTIRFAPMNDLPPMLFLPTYTANAWFHKKLPADLQAKPLAEAVEESRRFALGEYVQALVQGNALEPAARRAVAEKVSRYTGLSARFVENANLRITLSRFCKELLRDERKTVGRLDGRFTGFDTDAAGESYEYDPSNAVISGPFPAALLSYIRGELKYKTDTPYALSGNVRPWNYDNVQNSYLNTAETLRSAMAANRRLRVFVANGYYDGATPFTATEYCVRQMDLGGELKDRIRLAYYEAGHMMYISRPAHAQLKADLTAFIREAAGLD